MGQVPASAPLAVTVEVVDLVSAAAELLVQFVAWR